MSTAAILQEMERHAENDEWSAHANAETRLLQAPATTLNEIEPKIRYLAKMNGDIGGDGIEARILRSIMRDVDASA